MSLVTDVCTQTARTHGQIKKMTVMPLPVLSQQLCEWPWIFHPELSVVLEEAPAEVQVEHGVEHVHTLELWHVLQEAAVWMCSK